MTIELNFETKIITLRSNTTIGELLEKLQDLNLEPSEWTISTSQWATTTTPWYVNSQYYSIPCGENTNSTCNCQTTGICLCDKTTITTISN